MSKDNYPHKTKIDDIILVFAKATNDSWKLTFVYPCIMQASIIR